MKENELSVENLNSQVIEVLDIFTDQERKVLTLRTGLNDGRARTLEEVSKQFDIPVETVEQIEKEALHKISTFFRSKWLEKYISND